MSDEFENALAWFSPAPPDWIQSAQKNFASCAEWIWEVLQGDFNENASTAQVATGTVISMIPFVDQLCDVRDLIANCKKINHEPNESGHWFSLVLTLIGLFPSLGSLVKGCGKVAFAHVRKAGAASGATPRLALLMDVSIFQLNKFLARPEVIKTLKTLKIDNPYKYLAEQIREISRKLNTASLLQAFDEAGKATESMLSLVKKWGSNGLAKKAVELLEVIDKVRRQADQMLAKSIRPVQDYLVQCARKLEIEADAAHRAYLNSVNPHAFVKLSRAEEAAAFNKAKPGWVDNTGILANDPILIAPRATPGWTSTAPDPKRGSHRLDNAHETFHTMQQLTIAPGTKLYRIVDPTSADNSICWMTETEFKN